MPSSGTAAVAFGAFPGAPSATIDVTGQSGFVVTSEVEAWLVPVSTSDHSVDEHLVEGMDVRSAYLADGSFRIYCEVVPVQQQTLINGGAAQGQRLHGQWTIGWAWN